MDTNLFRTTSARPADAVNYAGGKAYALNPKEALASYAATGCLRDTFYADAKEQLDQVLALAAQVDLAFVAKVAVYARRRGHMKDMPAVLGAFVLARDITLWEKMAPHVYDNGRMVRNLVQAVRSGQLTDSGGKAIRNLPKAARRYIRTWLTTCTPQRLLNESVGNTPSLADIIRMVHPRPRTDAERALFGYLIGKKDINLGALPEVVQTYLAFRGAGQDRRGAVPAVDFRLLANLDLSAKEWGEVARTCGWQALRMNLNTLQRHGAFALKDRATIERVADRLRDEKEITRARVMPYQLLMAYKAASELPQTITLALQDAMEIATQNVPALRGRGAVAVDVSGSMSSPVTGHRPGQTSAVRCVDVGALVAACALRKNPELRVIAFNHQAAEVRLNPRDSIMTNAQMLAGLLSGGTAVGAAFALAQQMKCEGLWVVSDNESWADGYRGAETLAERKRRGLGWTVLHDLQPSRTAQADTGRHGVLHVGGFSDAVFDVVASFAAGGAPDHWSTTIDREVVL